MVLRRRNTICPPINLNLNDHQLENVKSYKYLGLLLSSDLSWTHHIESTCTIENFWAYYTANSVAILTHKLWQNSIPCETTLGIWSSSLASIYGQRYTYIGESSAVWITDLYKALEFKLPRLTRYLPVTLTGESEAFFVTVNFF